MDAARLPDRLLAPSERWGWEYRDPRGPVPPFAEQPPALDVAAPDVPARLAGRLERARRGAGVNGRFGASLGLLTLAVALPFGPLAGVVPGVAAVAFGWRAWGRVAWLR